LISDFLRASVSKGKVRKGRELPSR